MLFCCCSIFVALLGVGAAVLLPCGNEDAMMETMLIMMKNNTVTMLNYLSTKPWKRV
jgi:hypothetical protein